MLAIAGFAAAIALTAGTDDISTILWVLSIGYAAVALIQFALLFAAARDIPAGGEVAAPEIRRWWYFAVPWVALVVAGDFFFDIDLLLLAGHMPPGQLAVRCVHAHLLACRVRRGAVYAVDRRSSKPEALQGPRGLPPQDRRGQSGRVRPVARPARGSPCRPRRSRFKLFGPDFGFWVSATSRHPAVGLVVRSIIGPSSVVLSIHNRALTRRSWQLVPSLRRSSPPIWDSSCLRPHRASLGRAAPDER